MKKTLSILLAIVAILTMFACAFAEEPAEPTEEAIAEVEALAEDAEYEPNPDYDEYTYLYYEIEAASAEFVVTISRKADNSEFYFECNFFGDDQEVVATYDGTEYTVTKDKTSFMTGDTPGILDAAIAQNVWFPIGE